MSDNTLDQPPNRERSYRQQDHREIKHHNEQREGSHRSRQEYSRSPGMPYEPSVSRGRETYHGARAANHADKDYDDWHGSSHDYQGMYDEPQPGHRDYERDDYGDRKHEDFARPRSRSRNPRRGSPSQSPTRGAGFPNDTVILEGLPHGVSADELRQSLVNDTAAGDFPSIDVRVQSSRGQRRAFVQFESLDHAVAFVKEHYPKVLIQLEHNTDEVPDGTFDAYIHYARKRDEGDSRGPSAGNWNCPSCDFSNYATRAVCKICGSAPMANWQQSLTGAADAADVPSQILVVYPLASFVNETRLADEMKRLEKEKPAQVKTTADGAPKLKSTAPGGDSSAHGAREGSLHRVFLMRDVTTDESFKYGFAEFWTLEDAAAALKKAQSSRAYTVAGFAANVSTIHLGVFLPEDREASAETEAQSFHPLFNPALRVRYRDPHVYPSQHVVAPEPPSQLTKAGAAADDGATRTKKRKADGPTGAALAKKVAVPMGGQMALWQKKHDELHEGKAGGGEHDDGAGRASPPRTEAKSAIKISLSSAAIGQAAAPATAVEAQRAAGSASPGEADSVSYVDRDRLMCLICMRKYKSVDEVDIHERSRNHKTATEKEELVKAALPRLAARDKRRGKPARDASEEAPSSAAYRDRARERRAAHGQPTKPSAAAAQRQTTSKDRNPDKTAPAPSSATQAAAAAAAAAPTTAKAAQPAPSKGAGMLARMGWSTGGGLGANGEGRTEVIPTHAYREGVGLGAEGGHLGDAAQEAARRTKNSYADYVNTVQDRARERYGKLG